MTTAHGGQGTINSLYTIGYSTHSLEEFIELLMRHSITAVCDVRSHPYSRINPQFSRETLQKELKKNRIAYVFLGRELGARSNDPNCYSGGKVIYARLAKTEPFQTGLQRIRKGMKSYCIALMCAEKDPLECHRAVLIARHLHEEGIKIQHILENGNLESQEDAERRLLKFLKIPEADFFRTQSELIANAYEIQAQKIAYEEETKHNRQDGG
jgi:uncharacterized protein (DUF488 family)